TLRQDHAAAHEARDLGRAAVPHPRRLPDLRHDLHLQPGRERDRVDLDVELQHPAEPPEPWSWLGRVDPAVPDRCDHRGRVHQSRRRLREPGGGEDLLAPTAATAGPAARTRQPRVSAHAKSRAGWSGALFIVAVFSLIPILWIVFLSLKTP